SRGGVPCDVPPVRVDGPARAPSLTPGLCLARRGPGIPSSPTQGPLGSSRCTLDTCGPSPFAGDAAGARSPTGPPAAGRTSRREHGWTPVRTPAPNTSLGSLIEGTACPSARDCWSVGWSSNGTSDMALIEHWTGHGWHTVRSPTPPRADLVIYGLNS